MAEYTPFMFGIDIPKSREIIPFLLYCKRHNILVDENPYLADTDNAYKKAILAGRLTAAEFVELNKRDTVRYLDTIFSCYDDISDYEEEELDEKKKRVLVFKREVQKLINT